MGNRFFLVLAACVLVFVGLLVFNKNETNAPAANVSATNHTQGSGTVTLVEYGDFECVFCGTFYPVVKEVKEKYGDKITFQFRHFPIISAHPNAMIAHRAAEAAAKQGKFFEMHDLLYENQPRWSASSGVSQGTASNIIDGFAEQIGLNMEQYKADAASSAINDLIQADIKAGQDARVSATPTFFIDGKKLDSPRDNLDYFSEQIDAALAAKNGQ